MVPASGFTECRRRLASVAVALFTLILFAVACTSGDEGSGPTPSITPTSIPMADEVVQRRSSVVMLGAAPGRRVGQTPLEALETVEVAAGRQLDYVRAYVAWDGEFPDQRHEFIARDGRAIHLSISPRRMDGSLVGWADIANAKFGDPLFAEIQQWVGALAMFDGELFLTFHHEAEIEVGFGTATEFVAAWRRLIGDVHDRSPEIETVWVASGGSMRDQSINDWYPGDDMVDRIGADVFNWNGCRGDGEGWRTAQEALSPLIAFGAQHPTKPLVVAEIGSDEDPEEPGRKSAWLDELSNLLSMASFEQVSMVGFFHNDHSDDTTCDWWIDSSVTTADSFGGLAISSWFAGDDAPPAVVRCPSRLHQPGQLSDGGAIDTNLDGAVDLAFGAENRFVGVGEQGADGHDQRVIVRFAPLATKLAEGERVELRVRLGQGVPGARNGVRLVMLADPLIDDLRGFAAPATPVSDAFLAPDATGGYYSVDVTALVSNVSPSAFRLESTSLPLIDDKPHAFMLGMAEAGNEADRPALIVRSC